MRKIGTFSQSHASWKIHTYWCAIKFCEALSLAEGLKPAHRGAADSIRFRANGRYSNYTFHEASMALRRVFGKEGKGGGV